VAPAGLPCTARGGPRGLALHGPSGLTWVGGGSGCLET